MIFSFSSDFSLKYFLTRFLTYFQISASKYYYKTNIDTIYNDTRKGKGQLQVLEIRVGEGFWVYSIQAHFKSSIYFRLIMGIFDISFANRVYSIQLFN